MNLNFLFKPRDLNAIRFEAELVEPGHPCSFQLIEYLEMKRDADGRIQRDAIVPRELIDLLPWLFLFEPAGAEWRLRLIGTRLCSRLGADPTGAMMRDLFEPQSAADMVALYAAMAGDGALRTLRGHYIEGDFTTAETEVVQLPILARDGRTIHIFGGAFFLDSNQTFDAASGRDPVAGKIIPGADFWTRVPPTATRDSSLAA